MAASRLEPAELERLTPPRLARSRLRPILMTVLTTVMGMLPLAVMGGAGAELYQGLGAVIVCGLTFSTLFSLFFVPVLISLGYDAREAWLARRQPAGSAQVSTAQA